MPPVTSQATALSPRPTHPAMPTPDADGTLRPYPKPENARTVSYSELQSMDCWLKHDLQYRRGLRPRARFAALQLGSAWDAFLNEWKDPRWTPAHDVDERFLAALDVASAELAKEDRRVRAELADKDVPLPFDYDAPFERVDFITGDVVNRAGPSQLRDMATTILGMALHYRERYGSDEDWQTLGVQVWFEVPFPSRSGKRASSKFWLRGCIDRIDLHLPTGRIYVTDAKLSMNPINKGYREGFDRDPQLPLYGWALQQLGLDAAGGLIDASATKLPSWPELLAREVPCTDEHGEPIYDPLLCEECDGLGGIPMDQPVECTCADGDLNEHGGCMGRCRLCPTCSGEGIQRGRPVQAKDPYSGEPMEEPMRDDAGNVVTYASGTRKGEPKMVKVMEPGPVKTKKRTRPALGTNAHLGTTLPVYRAALDAYGLDKTLYGDQLYQLEAEWRGPAEWDGADSGFHWRTNHDEAVFTDAELRRAIRTMVDIGPYLDTLPATPMPGRMKCRSCSFKSLCPDADDTVIDEDFTTPEERTAMRERRREAREAAEARDASPEALAVMDAATEIPW